MKKPVYRTALIYLVTIVPRRKGIRFAITLKTMNVTRKISVKKKLCYEEPRTVLH